MTISYSPAVLRLLLQYPQLKTVLVKGSGPKGRLLKGDLLAVLASLPSSTPATSAATSQTWSFLTSPENWPRIKQSITNDKEQAKISGWRLSLDGSNKKLESVKMEELLQTSPKSRPASVVASNKSSTTKLGMDEMFNVLITQMQSSHKQQQLLVRLEGVSEETIKKAQNL